MSSVARYSRVESSAARRRIPARCGSFCTSSKDEAGASDNSRLALCALVQAVQKGMEVARLVLVQNGGHRARELLSFLGLWWATSRSELVVPSDCSRVLRCLLSQGAARRCGGGQVDLVERPRLAAEIARLQGVSSSLLSDLTRSIHQFSKMRLRNLTSVARLFEARPCLRELAELSRESTRLAFGACKSLSDSLLPSARNTLHQLLLPSRKPIVRPTRHRREVDQHDIA